VIRRANVHVVVLLAIGAALSLPALGWAASGGAGFGAARAFRATQATLATGVVHSGKSAVTAGGDGVTISTAVSGFLRSPMRFTGTVAGGSRGETVEIERSGHETDWSWEPTARSHLNRNGSFTVTWGAIHIGRFQFRAVVTGSPGQPQATSSPVTAIVYRWTVATWYGGSLYGNRTACGKTLTGKTLGTANRTLPCGTLVSFYYRGRTIVVPVIDRGPYANGADYDLTGATARKLGTLSAGIATLGAVSLPRR
jgi:hypothetical protein